MVWSWQLLKLCSGLLDDVDPYVAHGVLRPSGAGGEGPELDPVATTLVGSGLNGAGGIGGAGGCDGSVDAGCTASLASLLRLLL